MGFCQLSLFAGYAIYFPELFPTHLRSTGTSFCYNFGRLAAASAPFTIGRITRSLGVVRGITVRSRSLVGTLGATLQTLRGGNITLFTELCETSREEAFEIMVRHADDVGATGIIAVRYDATEVMQGVSEVLCYGTAVVLEPR